MKKKFDANLDHDLRAVYEQLSNEDLEAILRKHEDEDSEIPITGGPSRIERIVTAIDVLREDRGMPYFTHHCLRKEVEPNE